MSEHTLITLPQFLLKHGARVRRSVAMELLCIEDERTFHKVVDANPGLKHRIAGEGQDKYATAKIYELLPASSRCASVAEEADKHIARKRGN